MEQTNIKDLYNEITRRVLVENNVKSVYFMGGDFAKHYDRIEVRDGQLLVYICGLNQPQHRLGFDFTIDFANLLALIEKELFLAVRHSQTAKADIVFAF